MGYISPKARIRTQNIVEGAIVLGPSEIGERTYIDANCVIGYPIRRKVIEILEKEAMR